MSKRLVLATILAAVAATAQPVTRPVFNPEVLKAHMNFLASDLLEGRGTGTRGYRVAAEYVAAQFGSAGLEPGNGKSWLQTVPFRRTVAKPESTVTLTRDGAEPVTLAFAEGFMTAGDPTRTESIAAGTVVVAGYGITASDQKYDDYRGIDAKGKIVVIFSGAPKNFPNAVRAHHSSSLQKLENAAAHGAVGVINVSTPKEAARYPWPRYVRQMRLGAMHWLDGEGKPRGIAPSLTTVVALSQPGLETLFAGSPVNLSEMISLTDAGTPKSFDLPLRARIRVISTHEQVESPNVVGLLRGSDPKLRDEYVVYSSHLDHLGISDPVDGDSINNGALDNASGIAATIEIARALAATNPRPKRSILFVATTGEEKGLRGADYFANNPTVPSSQIVANINIDEILMMRKTRDLVPLGAETSTLGDAVARVAKQMNLELSPDPFPDEVFFVRSDQYPFVKQGIPAIYVGIGYKAVEGGVDAAKEQAEWFAKRYHSPRDDMSQPMDFSVAVMLTDFNYRLGLDVANGARPQWKPGDFFGRTFGRGR